MEAGLLAGDCWGLREVHMGTSECSIQFCWDLKLL